MVMAKLEFRYGAMNSGKSMMLLQVAYNYNENNRNVILLKSEIDTKGDDFLVSRIGPKRKVDIIVKKDEPILQKKFSKKIKNTECILVDEVQFLTPKQIEELWYITKLLDIPVICFGLKSDFTSNSFPGSKRLLELCDSVKELETICSCGKKARFNARKVNGKFVSTGEQNVIDGSCDSIEYVPLCGKCYIKYIRKIDKNKLLKEMENDKEQISLSI